MVRLRVVHILGSLGGKVSVDLISRDERTFDKAVSWDSDKRLDFALPFQDMKPSIYLDSFMPVVCELALTSSDRQTKIAACEFLHAVVVYAIGKAAQPGSMKKYSMTKLYKKLFPVVIQLACDVERVTEQLFQPLVSQCIHWFTGNTLYESPDTIVLLEAILEGIISPDNAALRDLSAQCVKEFLHWSIKQTTKQQQEKSPINTKSVLKRLYSMASHPSANKRLGAALAFNSVYTVFREESSLVDTFIMEMLVCVVNSLKLAHKDPKSLGTQDEISKTISHLTRIIKARASILNKPNKRRRTPRGLREAEMPYLVSWVLSQCGAPETACRTQCMNLFMQLAPLQEGVSSAQAWVKKTVDTESSFFFVSQFEKGGQGHSGILSRPTLCGDIFSVSDVLQWFDHLLAPLDAYSWAFQNKLLLPSQVFRSLSKKQSKLFTSLNFFLTKLSVAEINAAVQCFSTAADVSSVHTPHERELYSRAKCNVVLKIVKFVHILTTRCREDVFGSTPEDFWSDPLYETLVVCCLSPDKAGLQVGDVESSGKLPDILTDCLRSLADCLPSKKKANFIQYLKKKLLGEELNLSLQLRNTQGVKGYLPLQLLVNGYIVLNKTGLLKLVVESWESLPSQLLDVVMKVIHHSSPVDADQKQLVKLDPGEHRLCSQLLQLSLDLEVKPDVLVKVLVSGMDGRMMYQNLQSQICSHFAILHKTFVPLLMDEAVRSPEVATSVLGGVVDQVLRDLSKRMKYSTSLYELLTSLWGRLGFLWGEKFSLDFRIIAVSLLKKILTLEPHGLENADGSSFSNVFGTLQTLLEETQTTLSFKASVLELLPFFSDLTPIRSQQLRDSINRMISQQFPLKSTEFPSGSSMYHEYTAAVDKLVQAFVATGSAMLLQVLVGIVCREEAHVREAAVQAGLTKFAKTSPDTKVLAALESVYRVFSDTSQYPSAMRCAAANRVLLTMMRSCSTKTLKAFFVNHVVDLMSLIEAKESKMLEKMLEDQLLIKSSCLAVMEVLYTRLPALELNSTESEINTAYNRGEKKTGKELTKAATKVAHNVRSEYVQDDSPSVATARISYHCSAYNLLAAIIMCTQTKLDFYNVFLFKEDLSKGHMLWDNIIDLGKRYQFDIELDRPMERKKQLTAIRDEVQSGSVRSDSDSGESSMSPPGGHVVYMSSVYLAGSSLSQDVSQFDFSTGTQMMPRVSVPKSASETEQSYVVSEEHIEQDELNLHHCMGTFMKILDHMEYNKITPQVPKGTQPSDMPQWMSSLHKKFTDGKTHTNVRLFLARLVTNRPRVFEPYAKFWLPPLVQLIISGNTCGEGLHYFVVDLMVTLLMWSGTAILDDSYLSTRLLGYLMDNCHHDNRAIFRNNLEIVKTLVECWRSNITFPTESVYRLFSESSGDSKRNRAGIQLLGVMLANGLCPYEPSTSGGVTEERYYRALVSNLGNKYKEIYAATAEVLGMTLNYISEHAHTDVGPLHDLITEQLLALLQKREEDKFTVCLHKLAKAYPPLVDRLYSKVLFILPGQHASFKTMSLEILLARADSIPDLYTELKAKRFSQALQQRDEEMQSAGLGILQVMVRTMREEQIAEVLPQITSFSTHVSVQCRSLMYNTLVWIYNSLHSAESSTSEEKDKLLRLTRDHLLGGLSDDAESNRLKLFEFWNQESRLPSDTLGRLTQIFAVLYSPSTESQFLGYTTNLMLELTSRSPDYNRPVFDTPLSECKFQDQTIDLSWQQRHLQMTPMFAATQASSPGSTLGTGMGTGMLRSTQQSLAFQPTMDMAAGDSVGYNWMTPTVQSMDSLSFTLGSGSVSAETQPQSSLLFSLARSKQAQQARKLKPVGEGFGRGSLQSVAGGPSLAGTSEEQASISKLKRRFLKDRQATSTFYARWQVKKKLKREENRKYQKAARDSRVVMYRKYREGELPDIQIKYSEIIRPLQALAQRDGTLGRMLFTCVFSAIFGDVDKQLTEGEAEATKKAVRLCLNDILTSSTLYHPSFIGSLQSICFEQNEFDVDASSTATASLASSQQPMGVMVLEKQLLQGALEEDRARSSKRAKTSRVVGSETTSNWIQLARLYKSLGEYDVLRGIFSGHVGAKKITKDALEAEERSDYKKALDLYKEALSCSEWADGDPTEAEQDFWDGAQLNCYDHLLRWKDLQDAVEVNIDDTSPPKLDKLWEDSYYQENYLPYLVRSKVKLSSAGVQDPRFVDFLESSLREETKKAVLESRYSSELAMHYIMKNDYSRARYYVDISIQRFLEEWGSLSPLFEENRASCLRELQKLVEIREFFEFVDRSGSTVSMSAVDKLLEKWNSRFPHQKRDPISLWDDIVTNRCVLMEKMLLRCKESSADVSMSSLESMEVEFGSSFLQMLQKRFSKEYVKLYLKISETARVQGNYSVAKHYLQLTDNARREHLQDDPELPLRWLWSVTEMRLQQSKEDKSPRCVEAIVAVLKQFSTHGNNDVILSSPSLSRHHHHIYATALHHLANLIVDRATGPRLLDAFGDDKMRHLMSVALPSGSSQDTSTRDHKKVANWLYMKALSMYKQELKAGQDDHTATGEPNGMVSGYVSLASFCDRALRAEEEKDNPTQLEVGSFPRVVVTYMLKAMQYGSMEARQQFPRLLQLLELYPETVNEFVKKAKDVPVWMFLGWLNQMMAVLDKPEGRALHDIMFTLSREYPQALVYPFKISSTNFSFDSSESGRANKAAVGKIQSKLEMRAVDDFVSALEQLTTPELAWKDVCENDLKPLMEPEVSRRDKKALLQAWQQIYSSLFDFEGRTGLSAQSSESLYGTPSSLSAGQKQKSFISAYRKKIEDKFGKDGHKLASMKWTDYAGFVGKLNNEMTGNLQKVVGRGLLKEYSPWLVTFQPSLYPQYIEVPGQYTGDSKPLLDYHVKIAGFDEKILVLSSIRKPKRVTIRGDDEKEYMFLVKGGEDLRLDQRIEQLFGVMNRILQEDPACCQRGLSLTTYNVIPMTPRVGIIEWVQNTKPLKEFLFEGRTDNEAKIHRDAEKSHGKWLTKFSNGSTFIVYKEMYKKANRTETEKEYKRMVGAVPWDLSRRTFMQLAASPEAFLMLRSHFIRTYSTLCICHYVLGIGDRHLSNFMVDLRSGGMVGIDFGHAFGTATQFLPLPELIPFRLTPQIINLLLPQSESGQLRSCMIHTMRALRQSPLVLLNTMDVFVKEPSLDWKVNARKQASAAKKNTGYSHESQEESWYPKEKVDQARKKLEGYNPAHVMKVDLNKGHGGSLESKCLESLLMGDRHLNVRARVEVQCSSVEEQVACLIDQATDANILGRTWQGWEPWV
jgi:DNA-dependent protein kinase catalytic subunit